ncbi:MAG: TIGR01906 family membrane protein [Oscillospiraceae bacterium]|nr:TIGR01906 family membrane protein [Oscillospiraceae bacterium]
MKRAIAGFLLAMTVLVFTTALALAVIHIFDFPYIVDIDLLNISESSKISREEIMLNYNAMLDYLSPFSSKPFALPTFEYTQVATYHFAACKLLFNTVYLLGLISGLLLAYIYINRMVSKSTLKISGAITLTIPAAIGAGMLTNFDWTFNLFHSILFTESSWQFNPELDEIIKILPSSFFMHCSVLMTFFWLCGAAIQLLIGYLPSFLFYERT